MKKVSVSILLVAFILVSCVYNKSGNGLKNRNFQIDCHDAENSLDYCGTYSGIIPAADCPGINVTLSVNEDKTFYLVYDYIDRDSKFESKGIYSVKGNYLITVGEKNDSTFYKVEENKLRILDGDKQIIRGKLEDKFILNKNQPVEP